MKKNSQKDGLYKGPLLQWKGKTSIKDVGYYSVKEKEIYGDLDASDWQNKLLWGDNKYVLAHLLKKLRNKIDLIYIDPPFSSNTDYKKSIKLDDDKELSGELVFWQTKQYEDNWTESEYLQFMYERLQLMKELLSQKGSIFLHLDWRMDSYLRVILDEVFGRSNFINRITWKATNSPKAQAKGLGKQQNSILWYAKNKDCVVSNQVYNSPTKKYKARFNYNDEDGRGPYQTVPLVARGVQNTPNRKSFEFQGKVDKWLYSKEKLEEWWEDNRIHVTRNGNYRKKVYLKGCQGPPASDIWADRGVAPIQKEGYPTQKPESLLERIIKLASNEGDLIADFFCGSGTTLIAAEKLGRRWIGTDINKVAIQTARDRLVNLKQMKKFTISSINDYDLFKNIADAKRIIKEFYGIKDTQLDYFDGELNGSLVKIINPNRLLNKGDIEDVLKQVKNSRDFINEIIIYCSRNDFDLDSYLKHKLSLDLNIKVYNILLDKKILSRQGLLKVEVEIETSNDELVINLIDFQSSALDRINFQIKGEQGVNIKDFMQLIDSIYIDFNYKGLFQPDYMETENLRKQIRYRYKKSGQYKIAIKITDILGNELLKTFKVKINNVKEGDGD